MKKQTEKTLQKYNSRKVCYNFKVNFIKWKIMAQGFNDNLYLIDLSYLNTPSEVVYDLSSILEAEPARNQRIKLKLGKVDFNKSQLLSIK